MNLSRSHIAVFERTGKKGLGCVKEGVCDVLPELPSRGHSRV